VPHPHATGDASQDAGSPRSRGAKGRVTRGRGAPCAGAFLSTAGRLALLLDGDATPASGKGRDAQRGELLLLPCERHFEPADGASVRNIADATDALETKPNSQEQDFARDSHQCDFVGETAAPSLFSSTQNIDESGWAPEGVPTSRAFCGLLCPGLLRAKPHSRGRSVRWTPHQRGTCRGPTSPVRRYDACFPLMVRPM
jgi:hypothetical protein